MPVAVAVVVQRPVPIELRTIGTAQAYSVVEIRAQITGALTSVDFKEGEDVRQGQVLFTLDHRPLEAALQTAEGNSNGTPRRRPTRPFRRSVTRI